MSINGNGKNNEPHFLIEGGKIIQGTMEAPGAKNAALPIMAAAILAPGKINLCRVPDLSDVRVMMNLLQYMGAEVEFDGDGCMSIDTTNLKPVKAPYRMVKKLNASFDITGALTARFGDAHVPLPGGCVIGTRAVDQHLMGFRHLGCQVEQEPGGYIHVQGEKMTGSRIHFAKTSVGATKNVMMAACLARGKTILENVAREPEVIDLANFLNRCGARVSGHGTSRIEVLGVGEMSGEGLTYSIIPDRIVTGTYLLSAIITGGCLKITNTQPDFLKAFLRKLRKAGQKIEVGEDYIFAGGVRPIRPVGAVITEPHPGFPTDLQPPLVSLLSLCDGVSYVKEKVFDMRFNYVDDLRRMGASIEVDGNTAIVRGVGELLGAPVDAPDIRAGAAMVLAALAARGTSQVYGLRYIDRGYDKMEERLQKLGASIRRISRNAHRN